MKRRKKQNKKAEVEFFDRFDKEGGYDVLEKSGYEEFIDFMKTKMNPNRYPRPKGREWISDLLPAGRQVAQNSTHPRPEGQGFFAQNKKLMILDMGCGSGVFTSFLKKTYKKSRVIGIDISKGCIDRARKEYPRIEFVVDDVERTKFKSSSVDVIWYSGILHHFPDFTKVATEAFRLLKPEGLFFSYDPNFHNPAFWLYRHPKSPFYSKVGITSNERLLKGSEIRDVFNSVGFKTTVKAISGIKFRYVESKKTRSLLSIYNLWDKLLASTPFSSMIGAFLIGYGKKSGKDK